MRFAGEDVDPVGAMSSVDGHPSGFFAALRMTNKVKNGRIVGLSLPEHARLTDAPKNGRSYFRYLSSGGFISSAIAGSFMFSFVTKPTPVSTIGATFSPRIAATTVFTPR